MRLLVTFSKADRISGEVVASEPISRFILDKDYFRDDTGHVFPAAFMPSKKTNNTSIYRVKNWTDRKIWWVADNFVTRLRKDRKHVLARADTTANKILEQHLKIDPNPSPHPRHADIVGWPDEKSARKSKALQLAKDSRLHVRNEK